MMSGSSKNNLKFSARKLLQCGKQRPTKVRSEKYRNPKKVDWSIIESPQFVDFDNLPEIGDSFFCKRRMITSTPKVNVKFRPSAPSSNGTTMIGFLTSSSVSGIDLVSPNKQCQNAENVNEQSAEESVMNDTVIRVETNEPEKCKVAKKPLNIATSSFRSDGRDKCKKDNKPKRVMKVAKKPLNIATSSFRSDGQDKCKKDNKPKCVKKNLEEKKNPRVFRANPLPKYLKARKMEINKNKNKNAEKMDCDAIGKEQKLTWKTPPFVSCSAQRNLSSPKVPSLRTKTRAEETDRFNVNWKQNEMKVQQRRQMELMAKKKQEEKEIALLRKQTVHKAQPIRKYKMIPKIQKRPLTDTQSPMMLKRRRIMESKDHL